MKMRHHRKQQALKGFMRRKSSITNFEIWERTPRIDAAKALVASCKAMLARMSLMPIRISPFTYNLTINSVKTREQAWREAIHHLQKKNPYAP